MVSVSKVSRSLIAGLVAGVASWAVFMLLWALFPSREANSVGLRNSGYEQIFATVFGALIGLALGFVEGINTGSQKQLVRACVAFTIAGAVGGFLGIFIGQIVFGAIGSAGRSTEIGVIAFFSLLLARTLGWGLWGVGTGVALGIALGALTGSTRRLNLAATGGAIGGLLGGFLFQILGELGVFMSYPIQTLISFSCLAVSIAFFQSLAQELFKRAWIKVLVGRGEGREFQIAKPVTVIGRDELADIPLFGDNQIQRRHLIIEQKGALYTASAAAPGAAFSVNGRAMSQAPLKHGDLIQISSRQLQFYTRGGRPVAATATAANTPAFSSPAMNVPAGTCPYCGQLKDAAGNCACTVGAAQPQPQGVTVPVTQQAPLGAPAPSAASAPFTQATLEIIAGPSAGQSLDLRDGQSLTFGRAPEAEISVPSDNFMSRSHARVACQSGQISVQDLNSSNGTLVNGVRIMQQIVNRGDIITLGQTQIRVI
ncbi:MAG: FHA domain-containing protein [Armatimonadetes bacterium]|nr:FHA domain-containing protein [Armatimonadota bacterium]